MRMQEVALIPNKSKLKPTSEFAEYLRASWKWRESSIENVMQMPFVVVTEVNETGGIIKGSKGEWIGAVHEPEMMVGMFLAYKE